MDAQLIKTILGLHDEPFNDINDDMIMLAFVHKSGYSMLDEETRNRLLSSSYDYMEFIGDSVLHLVTTNILIDITDVKSEGKLTKYRQELNRNSFFETLMTSKKLCEHIITKGNYAKMCADSFEAIVGAIYLHLKNKRGLAYSSLDHIEQWLLKEWNFDKIAISVIRDS